MKLLDVNLLIYAVNSDSPLHRKAKAWLEKSLMGEEAMGFSWIVILAFIRLTTKPGLFQKHISPDRAFDIVAVWLDQPASRMIDPGPLHFSTLREMMSSLGTAGNLTSDAHLAALAIEHNGQLCSCDSDFARFPKLRWTNPLADR